MHHRGAEAMAANRLVDFILYANPSLTRNISAFRALLMSIFVSGTLPMIETHGLVVTNTASALLAWLGFG